MLQLPHSLILGSGSPRRHYLLTELGLSFTVRTYPTDEAYPSTLPVTEVAAYIARQKAETFRPHIGADDLVITADTVVILQNQILGKPENEAQALAMLQRLSGQTHTVATAVHMLSSHKEKAFTDYTRVTFRTLSEAEIAYYVQNFAPFDKAGAYGAQDWIGMVAIERIEGSYFTVMGLPVHRLYQELETWAR